MLGQDKLRSLATMMSLSGLSDKPSALREFCCIRARLCELVGQKISAQDATSYFSVGLISMLEAYFDKPIADILAMLRLHESIESAITTGAGDYGKVLTIIRNYQEGRFDDIDWAFLAKHQISPDCLTEMNNQSISWYQSLSEI